MRVLHVIPSISSARGGPSRAIQEMEHALSDRGIRITTVTTNEDGDGRRLDVPCGEPVETEFATRRYFPLNAERYMVSIKLGTWLEKNIGDFEVVHVHSLFSFASNAAAFFAGQRQVPYILRPLGVLGRYGMSSRRPYLKKLSLALIERRLIEKAAAVHFTSASERAEVTSAGLKCNGVVIPLGIDTANVDYVHKTFSLDAKNGINILFLSRIDRKKNLENLLRAISLVLSSGRNFRLLIAGDGDPTYVGELKELAQRLNIGQRVQWLGFVDGTEKQQAFSRAAAFVLPSYSENFGIAVVEALTQGLPCIVSGDVAISDEIGTARAGAVTGTDATSIAAGILEVTSNDVDYLSMCLAAHSLAKTSFSREAMGAELERLYRSVMR
jgi:glycosyltransferase involved in cell wall biosynthesis